MIVTCESCKSRYKIDDSKISGRGAKITCPRCKHQFVVYSTDKNAQPAMISTPQGSEWDDEPTRVGAKKEEEARKSAAVAAGPTAPPAQNAAEDDGPSYEVASPQRVQKLSAAEAAQRAPTLDFRKVGINAWKVKVKIGLIYDFSDLKTLRKYIQDGRVTPADLISFDGKSWKVIGEISDLDIFFVETYDQLLAEMSTRSPEEQASREPTKTPRMETPSLPEGLSIDQPQVTPKKNKPSNSGKSGTASLPPGGAQGSQPNRNNLIIGAVVVILALAAGIWWADRQAPAPAPAPAPSGQTPVDRDKLRNDLKTTMQPAELPPEPPKAPEEPVLTPVGPRGDAPKPGATSTTPAPGTAASTASDYVEAGDAAARAGRWAEAVAAYGAAAKKEPKNGKIRAKQGLAQFNAGNSADARTSLEEAVRLGAGKGDVLKTLGNILMADGDFAGAREYFQKYLEGKPKDAPAIEKKLKEMNGG